MSLNDTNKNLVPDFLKLLEGQKSADEFKNFYHSDIEQTEFPNAVTKNVTRTLKDLKDASKKGSKLLTKQEYEVKNLISVGDTVVLECIWRGTLAIPLGNISAGGQMTHILNKFFFHEIPIFICLRKKRQHVKKQLYVTYSKNS